MSPLQPPPWHAVGEILSGGAMLFAALFALAVATTFVQRSTSLRNIRVSTIQSMPFLLTLTDFLVQHAFLIIMLRILVSTAVCVVYVQVTYAGVISPAVRVFQLLVGLTLLAHYCLRIMLDNYPITLALRMEGFIEALSIASLLIASKGTWLNFAFLQAYIVMIRYFDAEPVLELMFLQKTSPFRRQLTRLSVEFVAFVFVFAGGIQVFELLGDPTESLTATTFELTLANSLYFCISTLSTAGYGDFVPYTLLGRLWVIIIILAGFIFVSRKVGQVIDVVSGLRRGMGSFVKDDGIDHCVVCGNVKWEYLKTFVQEFYADDGNAYTKIVVMCDRSNWTEELWNSFFTSQTTYQHNVVYLEGSCMSRDDLMRAQVETSLAVFVLNNQHDPQPYAEDSETLKRILTVRSFAPSLPIYSMCALRDSMLQITVALEHRDDSGVGGGLQSMSSSALPQRGVADDSSIFEQAAIPYGEGGISLRGEAASAGHSGGGSSTVGTAAGMRSSYTGDLSDDDDDDDFMVVSDYDGMSDLKSDAICMQEVEMSLLAENVFCNGLSTVLSNLVLNVVPQTKPTDRPWMVEYKIGAECRLAYVKLPMDLHGKRFADIAVVLYDYGILMLATKRFMDVKWRTITPDTIIHLNTVGLVVTFHSAQFIDKVMRHAAEFLWNPGHDLDDSSSDGDSEYDDTSSRGIPSVAGDDEGLGDDPAASNPLPAVTSSEHLNSDDAAESPGSNCGLAILATFPASSARVLHRSARDSGACNSGQGDILVDRRELTDGASGSRAGSRWQNNANSNDDPTHALRVSRAHRTTEGRRESQASIDDLKTPSDGSTANQPASSLSLATDSRQASTVPFDVHGRESATAPARGNIFDSGEEVPVSERGEALNASDAQSTILPLAPRGIGERAAECTIDAANRIARAQHAASSGATRAGDGVMTSLSRGPKLGREGSKVSFPSNTEGMPKQNRSTAVGFNKTGNAPRGQDEASNILFGDAQLPARLKGHIVVCVIGQMGLVNLKHFLDRVWMRRRGFKRETPVVAICPKITESLEDDIASFKSDRLYVIQGNSLSIATLKRAQYDRARAIVVLACEDKNDVDHMDAKAIFTVMTLDYLLGESSNTFVCTMLDAEESMQLLRAPAQARRRGADLGRSGDEYVQFSLRGSFRSSSPFGPRRSMSWNSAAQSLNQQQYQQHLSTTTPNIHIPRPGSPVLKVGDFGSWAAGDGPLQSGPMSGGGIRRGDTSFSFGGQSANSFGFGGDMYASMAAGRMSPQYEGGSTNMWSNRTAVLHQLVDEKSAGQGGADRTSSSFGAPLPPSPPGESSYVATATSALFALGSMLSPPGRDEKTMSTSATFSGAPGILGGNVSGVVTGALPELMGQNATAAAGAGPKHGRHELFEKQRYASGEMMISSVYVALLIREFAMPGIMSVVRKIFGAGVGKNSRSKKCWIRTTKIPHRWLSSGVGGQRTYRELFKVIIGLGGVPLGLYRSGEAMVRVQVNVDPDSPFDSPPQPPPPQGPQGPEHSLKDFGTAAGYGTMGSPQLTAHAAADGLDELHGIYPDGFMSPGPLSPLQSYTCPTTDRTATFEEVISGDNVLPYVYTNPEPYTLISEHDAVYILVHPLVKMPDEW
jgi:Calcium-activated BK potassium channel alpha subunit/Ion channel